VIKTFSILTPVRNAGSLLKRTIHSLQSQYAVQSRRCHLEHILLDGASTDDTLLVASRFPDTLCFSEPDSGMYDALRKGFGHVSGEVTGYLNAGDVLFPWAFDVLLDIFENQDAKWVTGYSSLINEKSQVTASWKPPRFRREFILNGLYADHEYPFGIQQESTFWRTKLLSDVDCDRLGKLKLAGDYFLWTEFAKHAELHSVMSPLGAFLLHDGQLSQDRESYVAEVARFIRKPNAAEKFTRWWETRCPPVLKGLLWNFTLGQSPAKIFDYNHFTKSWGAR